LTERKLETDEIGIRKLQVQYGRRERVLQRMLQVNTWYTFRGSDMSNPEEKKGCGWWRRLRGRMKLERYQSK